MKRITNEIDPIKVYVNKVGGLDFDGIIYLDDMPAAPELLEALVETLSCCAFNALIYLDL